MNDTKTTVNNDLPQIPVRKCPYRAPTEAAALREHGTVFKAQLPDGREAWVVSGYDQVRQALANEELSSDRRHPNSPLRVALPKDPESMRQRASLGEALIGVEGPEHSRQRRMLIPSFSLKRINKLRPGIQTVVDERIDAMLDAGAPIDLMENFALPIPSIVICELLGVPYADHKFFEEKSRLRLDQERGGAALVELHDYLARLVEAKKAEPGDGLLDDLIGTRLASGETTEAEIVSFALVLLIAGHDTTANMLTLGTAALLEHPDQLAALQADPELMPGAVEELMRYVSMVPGLPRVATRDIEIDGHVIPADSGIMVSTASANLDPGLIDRPDELDVRRFVRGHVGFGHGVHQCLGQSLARAELEIGFASLFERIPTLRFAEPPEAMPRNIIGFGLQQLMVAW
ncbi:MAG TPA: cytochrome P450 [Stackebrandtia sp.]|jgi:pentalenic acid synthase|uniref:cytochrome P450 n=1 Tax=Stackebrandtia sp. TaxID=2023065 RepID=UPI002D28D3B5|nr:cytochrome P450 [Stackebrandtia sp.]HZE37648.1 cytochrome P450 [Stackebrandtia sp.]